MKNVAKYRCLTKVMKIILVTAALLVAFSTVAWALQCRGGYCNGTDSNNTIWGTTHYDKILARAGHDTVYADSGSDDIYLGPGNDDASGDNGHDLIKGVEGHDDWLTGGNDNDTISGLGTTS
jgi:hypothetical protein